VKSVREVRNQRRRGENRRDSAGDRSTQPINWSGLHDGSAANSVSEFRPLIIGKLIKISDFYFFECDFSVLVSWILD
jgi:hypothetical protein